MDRFEVFRKLVEDKKRKGEEKKPRYGTRKLSVGLVSCVLGFMMFLTPITASAEGASQDQSLMRPTTLSTAKLMVSWIMLELITPKKIVTEYT